MFNKATRLYKAVENGDIVKVRKLLKSDFFGKRRLKRCEKKNESPIIRAAVLGHSDIVQEILDRTDRRYVLTESTIRHINNLREVMHVAAARGDFELVAKIMEIEIVDPVINGPMDLLPKDETVFFLNAVKYGQISIIKKYRNHLNSETMVPNRTLLCEASKNGQIKILKYLLEEKFDVTIGCENSVKSGKPHQNPESQQGWTPLMFAACHGQRKALKLILNCEQKQDINAVTSSGWTPLMWAARNSDFDAVKILMERGADQSIKNKDGQTVLDIAINSEDLKSSVLLAKGDPEFVPNFKKELNGLINEVVTFGKIPIIIHKLKVLNLVDEKTSNPLLIQLCRDGVYNASLDKIIFCAMNLLYENKCSALADLCMEFLNNMNGEEIYQIHAVSFLGKIKDKRAVPRLIQTISWTSHNLVRWPLISAAATALGEVKDPQALDALKKLTKDQDLKNHGYTTLIEDIIAKIKQAN